nr:hypothetical protein [uncultured Roseovarius sp.]
MIPYWPTTLPQRPSIRAAGGPMDNRVSFEPDFGAPIQRPKASDAPELFDIAFEVFTLSEYEIFKAWFKSDLAFGANRFIWRHPIGDAVEWFRVAAQEPPFNASAASGGQFVSLTTRIMRLPGTPWFADYVPDDSSRVPDFVADYDNGVYGIDGEKVAAASLTSIAGDYFTITTDGSGVTSVNETLTGGDIPATAPGTVTSIIGFAV